MAKAGPKNYSGQVSRDVLARVTVCIVGAETNSAHKGDGFFACGPGASFSVRFGN